MMKTTQRHIRTIVTLLCLIVGVSSSSILAQGFAGGTGTKKNPYIISNAAELEYFVQNYNNKTDYYKITNDIDLGDIDWTDKPIGTFNGHLIGEKPDGTKPIISNYKLNVTVDGNFGLLRAVSGAEIRNIGISKVTITLGSGLSGTTSVGAFIGSVTNGSLIEGCSAGTAGDNGKMIINVGQESLKTMYCSAFIGLIGTGKNTVRNCSVKNYTGND